MGTCKDLKNCFSFLTRLPVRLELESYDDLAAKMWLFPVVGLVLGFIAGISGVTLANFLPELVVGFILLGLLLLLTGAHHTDGLIDFGDGLMVQGTPERKIDAMHDVAIGAGGFVMGFAVLSLTGIAMSYTLPSILLALVLAEVGAKTNMVAACAIGKSAATRTTDPFVRLNTRRHLTLALILSFGLVYTAVLFIALWDWLNATFPALAVVFSPHNNFSPLNLYQIVGIFATMALGMVIPLVLVTRLAMRHFHGLTGDCLGALNEITRVFTLILFILLEPLITSI